MTAANTGPDVLRTFVVLAEHPRNGVKLDVELIASTPGRAITRAQVTLMHVHADVAWMAGTFTILSEAPLPPRQ